jgi:hypothetical protein
MTPRFVARWFLMAACLPALLIPIVACHSYHIDTTVQNQTGAGIQLLEVDYPNASFGVDRLAAGALYHYRFTVTGDGPIKVTYTSAENKQVQITGPTLVERQQGHLTIVLLPEGKAQFVPEFAAAK